MPKLRLGINIDHVATLRNARKRDSNALPDIVRAAEAAVKGGADGITFHLREDRRHIVDEDVKRLKKKLRVPINFEMAATSEMLSIALQTKPKAVCIVPEKRQEVTTEGGLDVIKGGARLAHIVNDLAAAGIRVSLFIDPELKQVAAAYEAGAAAVELHTGSYAHETGAGRARELKKIKSAAQKADALGLEVHAGHGLDYENVAPIAAIRQIVELNIGHALVGEAIFIGLENSVRQMRRIMNKVRR
ncbi:MAG TPA: pyridoxine 5'-phosphate synthase [Alphaproteobacteria bacterium]|nr:pyridoxine 5'-phosphate synthase [Alphaproteobacteria bacterium]